MVRKLTMDDIDDIYKLSIENTLYYEYCPPLVSKESIAEDIVALPSGKTHSDKYYVGYFDNNKLIAVLDLIDGYPENDVAFIGFFMTDIHLQKKGLGSEIIAELLDCIWDNGFQSARLAWVKGNPQAEHFWRKNGFVPIKETTSTAADCVILAENIARSK